MYDFDLGPFSNLYGPVSLAEALRATWGVEGARIYDQRGRRVVDQAGSSLRVTWLSRRTDDARVIRRRLSPELLERNARAYLESRGLSTRFMSRTNVENVMREVYPGPDGWLHFCMDQRAMWTCFPYGENARRPEHVPGRVLADPAHAAA